MIQIPIDMVQVQIISIDMVQNHFQLIWCNETIVCNIKKESGKAKVLLKDEISMIQKHGFDTGKLSFLFFSLLSKYFRLEMAKVEDINSAIQVTIEANSRNFISINICLTEMKMNLQDTTQIGIKSWIYHHILKTFLKPTLCNESRLTVKALNNYIIETTILQYKATTFLCQEFP